MGKANISRAATVSLKSRLSAMMRSLLSRRRQRGSREGGYGNVSVTIPQVELTPRTRLNQRGLRKSLERISETDFVSRCFAQLVDTFSALVFLRHGLPSPLFTSSDEVQVMRYR